MMESKSGLSLALCLLGLTPLLISGREIQHPKRMDERDYLLALGLLDVTRKPYCADPKGEVVEGTRRPFALYSLNVERITKNPQAIIRNARSVRIYYFKVEAGTRNMGDTGGGDENVPGCIENSREIRIYCMYGNVKGLSGDRAMLEVIDSRNVLVAQLKAFFPSVFPHIKETIGYETHSLPSSRICALYLRN